MRVLRFFLFISKGVLLLTAMTTILWLTAVVILSCVLFQRLSGKVGVPALLFFILLGMFFGTDGVVKIPFDNFELAQNVCSVALLFIMFYGGFGTNVRSARPVAEARSSANAVTACPAARSNSMRPAGIFVGWSPA